MMAPVASWLVRYEHAAPARRRLFCFHHAGGGALAFVRWPLALPDDVEVCAAQLPGRELRFRDPPVHDMHEAVAALADAMTPLLDRPYALFGHSMGALIALELARELDRRGLPAADALFAAGSPAPHRIAEAHRLHALDAAAFRRALIALDARNRAVIEHAELWALLEPVFRADFALVERYQPRAEPPIAVPVIALGGADDPVVAPDALDAWRDHTRGAFTRAVFPGDHFFIASAEAEVLRTVLARWP
ncbi:MAG TPA: alpha/beta fold hydrolase [Kofleriaceae bacterium]|nr:alpha/beta fold hydrolase [Kofleriaceae bacterium]